MNRFLIVCLGVSAAASGVACALSPTADLFAGQGGASASTGGDSTDTVTGSVSTGGATTSSATTTSGPGPTTGVTTSTSGTGGGASSSASTGVTTTTTTTATASSSTGSGSTGQVYCNSVPCNIGEICCFNPIGPGDHCGLTGQCGNGYVELTCNGPEDCPGQICCATFTQSAGGQFVYKGISCDPNCNGPNQVVVCSQGDPTPCPPNTQCNPSNIIGAGYSLCY